MNASPAPHRWWPPRTILPVMLASLAAGCDVQQPMAPASASEVAPARALVDPVGGFSASGFLSVPSNNTGLSAGSLGWTSLGIPLGKNMWIRVRTSGTIAYTINPAARDTPCDLGCLDFRPVYGEGEAGGAGIGTTYKLRASLGVRHSGSGAYAEPISRPYGGNQLEWVVQVGPGWELAASRSGIPGGPSCTNQCIPPLPQIGWYRLSGGTSFNVEEVIPLQAAPRKSEVVRGDSVTFDAVAIEGTTRLQWYFGDQYRAARVRDCDGKTTCTVAPTQDGFMWVYGDYAGTTMFSARSEPVRVVTAKLILECTPNPVTRGDEMNCTAKPDPSTARLSNVRWAFTDIHGNNIPGPSGDQLKWGGVMVVGGTMKVSGEVDGAALTAEPVKVEVEARTGWRVSFPPMPEPERSSELRYPPVATAGAPVAEGVFGKHVYPHYFPGSPIRGGTGPNQNWYFIRAPLEVGPARILINPGLYADDPFYRAQRGGIDENGYRRCDGAFMRGALQFVIAHERRHHEIAAAFYAGAGSDMLEAAAVYSPPTQDIDEVVDMLFTPTETELEGLQSAFDAGSKLQLTCKLQPLRNAR